MSHTEYCVETTGAKKSYSSSSKEMTKIRKDINMIFAEKLMKVAKMKPKRTFKNITNNKVFALDKTLNDIV
jgi:hypothetical protein